MTEQSEILTIILLLVMVYDVEIKNGYDGSLLALSVVLKSPQTANYLIKYLIKF